MTPKFIEHIHLDIPKDLTPKENALGDMVCSITNKIMIEQVEKIDNEICERIKDIAILNGIDEVYVIDRNAILSALEKQIPKKPMGIYDENEHHIKDEDDLYEPALFGVCPVCNQEVQDGMIYCSFCGQALDWRFGE